MRKITQIHEIELSSRCNLACVYCPNPTMKRAKLDMTWQDFELSLERVRYFCEQGTQGELALTGVGEALLNPIFARAVLHARRAIGWDRLLTFATNGLLLTAELLEKIRPAQPVIFVSLHRPEAAGPAIAMLERSGLRYGTNSAFVTDGLNWAGQVDWPATHHSTCEYLRAGWCVIRADGTVGTCCWDAESDSGRIGTIHDDPPWYTAPHRACDSCSLSVPEEVKAYA
jgi:hypothetical protein